MRDRFFALLQKLTRKSVRNKWLAFFSAIVLIITTNLLTFEAVTWEKQSTCGFDEHEHSEACLTDEGAPICGIEEHVHTEACYQVVGATAVDAVESTVTEEEVDLDALEEVELDLGDDGLSTEGSPEAIVEVQPEESLRFSLADREYALLSEIITAVDLPVSIGQVVEVLQIEDLEQGTVIQADRLSEDWLIYPVTAFEETELLINTGDELLTVMLTDGNMPIAQSDAAAEDAADDAADDADAPADDAADDADAPADDAADDADAEAEDAADDADAEAKGAEAEAEDAVDDGEEDKEGEADAEEAGDAVEEVEQTEETEEGLETSEEESPNADAEAAAEGPADESESAIITATETVVVGYRLEYDLTGAEYPLSLLALMDRAEPVFEAREVAVEPEPAETVVWGEEAEPSAGDEGAEAETTEAAEPEAEGVEAAVDAVSETPEDAAVSDETPVDAPDEAVEAPAEPQAAESAAEDAGDTSADEPAEEAVDVPAEAESNDALTIEYDAGLLDIRAADGDHLITPVADFDRAEIHAGDYAIVLLNGSAPAAYPAQTFEGATDYVTVTVHADAGAFPEGTTMRLADVGDEDTLSSIEKSVADSFVEVQRVHAVDITFCDADGNEIEPLIPISVVMTAKEIEEADEAVVVHVTDAGETALVEAVEMPAETEDADETGGDEATLGPAGAEENGSSSVEFIADAFSVYAMVITRRLETRVLASDGETYKIEVTYGPDAGIPDGAVLAVSEVMEDAAYRSQVEASLAGNKMITLARFFDIKIMESAAEDAAEVHPLKAVDVKVTLYDEQADPETEEAAEPAETPVDDAASEQEAGFSENEPDAELSADGYEAVTEEEPEKPDSHIIISDEKQVCAAHFAEASDVVLLSAAEDADAVTFSASGFSVWGVVYTVDFYYGNYEYHIPGESEILLSALFELLRIDEDAASVAQVAFSNPELLSVERLENDWRLTSLAPFDTDETLTVTMNAGYDILVLVKDAAFRVYCIPNDDSFGRCANSNGYSTLSASDTNHYELHVSVTATAYNDYRFVRWLRDDGAVPITQADPAILDRSNTVDRETTFVCYFAPNNANIAIIKPTANGSVSGGTPVNNNAALPQYCFTSQDTTLTATPDNGFYFKGWLVNGRCVSTNPSFTVNGNTITEDALIEPVFSNSATPWFELKMTEAENNSGYFVGSYSSGFHGLSYYYGRSAYDAKNGHHCINPSYAAAVANTGYTFHYWLRDDGTTGVENNFPDTVQNTGYRGLRNEKNLFDVETSFVAFFAPGDTKIIRLNFPEDPNAGSVGVASGSRFPRAVSTCTGSTFYYYYNTDGDTGGGVTIVATPNTDAGYEFLGWYNNGVTLVSRDREYTINSTKNTYDMNLVPVFELDAAHRDFYYVYFDGSNGVSGEAYLPTDTAHADNTLYARYDSSRTLHGANFACIKVNKDATITLPSGSGQTTYSNVYTGEPTQTINLTRPQGTQYNNFDLYKWYRVPAANDNNSFGSSANYLDKGASVTVNRDMVFYADWFPTSYDFSAGVSAFTEHDAVTHPDTSGFISTYLYDYSPIFNMPSLKLSADSTVNRTGNYEYWVLPDEAGNPSRNFLFITALSDEVRTVSPRNRKQSLRNQSRETTTAGTFYSGITSTGILSTSGLKDALFDRSDGLGKRYVGEGKNLYLYDDATGYYYYDSDKNAAKYNGSDAFVLSDEQHFDVIDKSNKLDGDFLPFNLKKSGEYVESTGEPNYWFGMQSTITFFLPNQTGYKDSNNVYGNRSTKNQEMVFKFCGDDDVWVFVDDNLILDMGGVHGKVYGEINFSRGTWTIAQNGAGKISNSPTIDYFHSGNTDQISGDTFSLGAGEHHLTICYLERGASQSNCAIYFNIAPAYGLRLVKKDAATGSGLGNARFGVYIDEACTQPAEVRKYYDPSSATFVTGSGDGQTHISYFYAGRTYYIKEEEPPAGYPDVSDKVIKLVLSSTGVPSVYVKSGDQWVSPGEGDVALDAGIKIGNTPFIVLNVPNTKNQNITAKKTWKDIDGNTVAAPENAQVSLTLHRYKLVNPEPTDNPKTRHKVQIVVNYLMGKDENDADIPIYADSDVKTIKRAYAMTYPVDYLDTVSFTVTANHNDRLAIYKASGVVETSSTASESYYGVGNSRRQLPVAAVYSTGRVTRDTTVFLYLIGDTGDRIENYLNITQPTITKPTGEVQGLVSADEGFTLAGQLLTVTLPSQGNWSHTWTDLPQKDTDGTTDFYYYVTEDAVTIGDSDKTSFYSDMYSSFGIAGGNIEVTNQYELVKVKLRKQDASNKENLADAQFMIYTSYDVENGTGTLYTPKTGYIEGNYSPVDSVYTSTSDGNFYVGYLPLGRYWLVETAAPSGYNMLDGPVEILVEAHAIKYRLPGRNSYDEKTPDNKGYINVYIPNTPGYALPSTGGPGTAILYAAGLSLILAAILGLFLRTRSDKRKAI